MPIRLGFGFSALVHMFARNYEISCDHAERAIRLSPFDPLNYHPYLALSWVYLFTNRNEEAGRYANLAIQVNPGFSVLYPALVVSHVRLDRLGEAQKAGLRLLETAPDWRVDSFIRMGLVHPDHVDGFAAALRTAGLPG